MKPGQKSTDLGPLLAFGAHPDDIEFGCAGSVARWVDEGAEVTYCIVTDGSTGTADLDLYGEKLAAIRRDETLEAAKIFGVTDVRFLGYRDGYVEYTLDLRKDIARVFRDVKPTRFVVMDAAPILGDWFVNHPDHRAVGQLAQDTAVVVAAPFFAPYTPPTKGNPIYLFYSDGFKKPYPFDPIIAVGIDDVAQKKWDCISALPSQFGDADSWQARYGRNVPTDEAGRKAFLLDIVKQRNANEANQYRDLLIKLYGEQKGRAIKYAETFELNQYGAGATVDQLKGMFPTFEGK